MQPCPERVCRLWVQAAGVEAAHGWVGARTLVALPSNTPIDSGVGPPPPTACSWTPRPSPGSQSSAHQALTLLPPAHACRVGVWGRSLPGGVAATIDTAAHPPHPCTQCAGQKCISCASLMCVRTQALEPPLLLGDASTPPPPVHTRTMPAWRSTLYIRLLLPSTRSLEMMSFSTP